MKKKTVTIFTGPQGHYSIAKAIEQTLENKYQVKIFYQRDILFSFYIPLYQLIPQATRLPFFLSQKILAQNKRTVKLTLDAFRFKYSKLIEDFISLHQPDCYISTYFMFNSSLERFQHITAKPFINIMTDPRTIHRLLISDKAKANLAFDQQTVKDIKKMSSEVEASNYGWFVRDEFDQEYDQNKVRQQLNLDPDQFTILIASGSDGTNMVLKILPTLMSRQPIQVIVACGNNKTLFQAVTSLQQFINSRKNYKAQILPIGFTKEMHQYMQAADLVVGKAGPNTLFETVATHTPFFAITHIAGQEDGNLDIIRKQKLGFVEENPLKASHLLNQIIEKPQMLNKFSKGIAKMADKNKQAKVKLLQLMEQLIGE